MIATTVVPTVRTTSCILKNAQEFVVTLDGSPHHVYFFAEFPLAPACSCGQAIYPFYSCAHIRTVREHQQQDRRHGMTIVR